jgi:hypothetical protein
VDVADQKQASEWCKWFEHTVPIRNSDHSTVFDRVCKIALFVHPPNDTKSLGGSHARTPAIPNLARSYLSAMMEIDSAKLKAKIATAERNIRTRTFEMPESSEERQAISDAVNALRYLTRCGWGKSGAARTVLLFGRRRTERSGRTKRNLQGTRESNSPVLTIFSTKSSRQPGLIAKSKITPQSGMGRTQGRRRPPNMVNGALFYFDVHRDGLNFGRGWTDLLLWEPE